MEDGTSYSGASMGQAILAIIGISFWLGGIVLVKGFWLSTLATIFFPYAWYVFVAKLMLMIGMV